MNRRVAVLVSLVLHILRPLPSFAVTTTDLNSITPLQLAQALAGPGVTVSNVTFTGANVAGGTFTGGVADGLGIESGIILSSGDIANAAGPNENDGVTGTNDAPGDADLNAIVGAEHTTFDAAVLEFDFVPSSSTVSFRYVFASDEYNEFVGQFNDVFAFFIDGQNVALIPGTTTPVAINTVNLQTNSNFYRNNDPSDLGIPTPFLTQFDGFTTVLTATATLTPNVSHHIKLAIADTDDDVLDSAVFLQAASFTAQNLTIGKSAPPSVPSGANLTYTLTYGNTGGSNATNVFIEDPLPAGTTFVSATNGGTLSEGGVVTWNIGTVDAGATGRTVSFTVRVDATSGTIQNANYTIEGKGLTPVTGAPVSTQVIPGCGTITLSPSTLPGGAVGAAYERTITASGGTAPFSFSVTGGSLPPGLALSGGGALSGTPTTPGSFSFTVTATDANECSGSRSYSLEITGETGDCPEISLSPVGLLPAPLGLSYRRTITATGGTGPYSFSLISGALPPGLRFSSSGSISGTPTALGTYTFRVQARDARECTGTRTYSLTIACAALTLSPASLPPAAVGAAYSQAIAASGSPGPHAFTVTGGALPAGLALSPEGVLSGTPTAAGTFSFTITAADAGGCSGSRTYSVSVCATAVTVSPAALPAATVGSPYSQTIAASGGTGPFTFAATALPPGLTLSSTGLLSGTPTTAGLFAFTVTATDAGGCPGVLAYSFTVCPVISISPPSLPSGAVGTAYDQTFSGSGGAGPYTFAASGSLPPGLALSAAGVLSGAPTQSGTFSFTVTATDAVGCTISRAYTVTLTDAPPVITDLTLSPAATEGFTLAIVGSGFADGATVLVNGVAYPATFVSPTLLLVALPPEAVLTAGAITVMVVNPGAAGGTSNPATLTFCEPPQPPLNPVIRPAGNPTGPLTATDFLQVSWDPPAVGPAPAFYEFRINGDAWTRVTGTTAIAPPRGNDDPITLTVRAHCNAEVSSPEVSSVTYSLAPPVANFTFSAARVGSPVVFTDTSSPQATSWLWIFDDGDTSTLQSPTHTFTTAGTHRVALIATNGSGSSQTIKDVPVSASTASGGTAMRSRRVARPFATSGAGRWRLAEVAVSASERLWLELTSEETGEAVVYLRFLDPDDRPLLERRISVAPGQRAVNDVGAFGLEGSFTIELVSSQRIAPRLAGEPEEPTRRTPDEKR